MRLTRTPFDRLSSLATWPIACVPFGTTTRSYAYVSSTTVAVTVWPTSRTVSRSPSDTRSGVPTLREREIGSSSAAWIASAPAEHTRTTVTANDPRCPTMTISPELSRPPQSSVADRVGIAVFHQARGPVLYETDVLHV